jgi:hypothetical protein
VINAAAAFSKRSTNFQVVRPGACVAIVSHERRRSMLLASSFSIDIHVPVRGIAYDAALAANAFLNKRLGSSAIDFSSSHTPHVTLYLTAWSCPTPAPPPMAQAPPPTCVQRIQLALASLLYSLGPPCSITLSSPYAAGAYAMANVTRSACLQEYSDLIVNATHQLSQPNQSVPSWVYNLPEPERREKIELVRRYGSPNVFAGFDPHVTLAWSNDTNAVVSAISELRARWMPSAFSGELVAAGSTGHHGTVLQGRDVGVYNVSQPNTGAWCQHAYTKPDLCNADNVTDGGCIWCDVVDHPPFCTSQYNARQFQPPPQGQPFMCTWAQLE